MMQTFVRPSRDLRNHYAEISEMLRDHDHVIITNHGRGESVLINIEDYVHAPAICCRGTCQSKTAGSGPKHAVGRPRKRMGDAPRTV